MGVTETRDVDDADLDERVLRNELWPLDAVDPKNAKFPCCVVWTPLPVVSWLAPFIGHVGICREDGTILDFAGSNFVNINDFSYGAVARYLQLDREQCCFPPNLSAHTCKQAYRHMENGVAMTWDDALNSRAHHFAHKSYNLFTCNCHSYVADCMNRLCYGGELKWNMVTVASLILFKGRWVDNLAVVRSFFPFVAVIVLGMKMVGWPFLLGLGSFSLLLMIWFLFATYCAKGLLEY
ncbi:Protein REVERSION-TO-ETHYLENE SENSITIVITY1 [Ranunculus cassubicifolius]